MAIFRHCFFKPAAMTCFLTDNDLDGQKIFNIALQEGHSSVGCVFANDRLEARTILKNAAFIPVSSIIMYLTYLDKGLIS